MARTYHPIDNYALKTGLYRGVIEISSSANLLLQLATSQGLKPTKRTPFWPNRSTYQRKKKKKRKKVTITSKNNKNSNNDNNDNNTNNNIRNNNNNINSNGNNKIIIPIIIMMKITTITKIIIM